ncbi:hypothetical protein ACWEO4_44285 [Streptomyces sp. NPDC004393]
MVLSEKQLHVVAFSDTDFPLLKRAPTYDRTGVTSIRYKADAGGPECTIFLNAQFLSGSYYHGLHEVDRGYTLTTTDRPARAPPAMPLDDYRPPSFCRQPRVPDITSSASVATSRWWIFCKARDIIAS